MFSHNYVIPRETLLPSGYSGTNRESVVSFSIMEVSLCKRIGAVKRFIADFPRLRPASLPRAVAAKVSKDSQSGETGVRSC